MDQAAVYLARLIVSHLDILHEHGTQIYHPRLIALAGDAYWLIQSDEMIVFVEYIECADDVVAFVRSLLQICVTRGAQMYS